MNLNDRVKVRLTEAGQMHLCNSMGVEGLIHVDLEGYTEFHLWKLMSIFGDQVESDKPAYFEDNEIVLVTGDDHIMKCFEEKMGMTFQEYLRRLGHSLGDKDLVKFLKGLIDE